MLFINKKGSHFLKRKRVLCYDHLRDKSAFNEMQLPPKESFYSKLIEQDINGDDSHQAMHAWNHFNMFAFGEYNDLFRRQMC